MPAESTPGPTKLPALTSTYSKDLVPYFDPLNTLTFQGAQSTKPGTQYAFHKCLLEKRMFIMLQIKIRFSLFSRLN